MLISTSSHTSGYCRGRVWRCIGTVTQRLCAQSSVCRYAPLAFGILCRNTHAFSHNGLITAEGEEWYMEQPGFSPGFCVNGLVDMRLNSLMNLRFTPGLYFGNRDITMREYNTGAELRQNVKTTCIVLPVDLKFSGMRYRQSRPYITAGVMPAFNITRSQGDYLRTVPAELFLTAGFGCDFYLPYFKLVPEVKFCFGITDAVDHDRPDLEDEPDKLKITRSLRKALSRMVVFTFYFE